jgi:hypothetical protein
MESGRPPAAPRLLVFSPQRPNAHPLPENGLNSVVFHAGKRWLLFRGQCLQAVATPEKICI